MDKCAVYLMQDGYSGDVKIGISNNPELRHLPRFKAITTWAEYPSSTKRGLLLEIKPVNTKSFSFSILRISFRAWWTRMVQAFATTNRWLSCMDEASTQSRVYNVRTLTTKIWKTEKEDRRDCWSAF